MVALHKRFPHYGFDRHKGYSTEQHIAALRIHGISEVHRRSFAPVRESMAAFGDLEGTAVAYRTGLPRLPGGGSRFP